MKNKILIVDDEKEIADIISDFLIIEGFETIKAYNGKDAIKYFDSFSPNLIILDIMLPDIDGMELCKRFRNNSDVTIIMLSAKDGDIDKILSLGLGADEYLTKPFSPSVLVAYVKAHLRRYMLSKTSNSNKDILIFDNFKIDKKGFSVIVGDKKINLVPKEFEILLLLAENKGKVFTKEDIYNSIWGADEFGEISTVTVHIRKIRTKIEKDPSNPKYLHTIWGAGYKFDDI